MKDISLKKLLALLLLAIIVILVSCKKEAEEQDYSYYVSSDFATSYSTDYINYILNIVSESYTDINELRPLVNSDVNVYKLIYGTSVSDNEINASGLVCTPAAPGYYPVLCFQNGTNTMNAYAPSEFVTYTAYQLIEIVASMGYIVVIPDYPGFGESEHIPHPYLIAEPTARSIIDMLFAVNEFVTGELPGIDLKNEYYLLGYSQGGWATLLLHKTMELNYPNDFNLKGSACGAGPYDMNILLEGMINSDYYSMPVYIGYIVYAYSAYDQFTNPVADILNEPYARILNSLYTGSLTSEQINNQLTTSIPDLLSANFISGYAASPQYESVRQALDNNSIPAWETSIPLYLVHGEEDTDVNPVTTENLFNGMIQAGASPLICIKEIIPGADHGDGVVPGMLKGLLFLKNLRED